MKGKGAILVINRKDECVKWFKTWGGTNGKAKVEICFKDKNGEKKKLVKEYDGWGDTVPLIKCCEAVIRYWPRYDPNKYTLALSGGHHHEIRSKRVKNGR